MWLVLSFKTVAHIHDKANAVMYATIFMAECQKYQILKMILLLYKE